MHSETNNPAYGSDFCGFAWSGGYSVQSSNASATFSTGGSQSVYLAEATANAGRVWEFDEYVDLGDNARYYVSNADFNATLKKSTLTGGNNTAEVVMKYIHTYQQKTGSITINAVPQGVGNGFTLSNTSKQWSLSCVIGDFPY